MLISSAMIIRSLFTSFTDVTLPSGIEEDDLDDEIEDFMSENDEVDTAVMFAVFTPVEVIHETYEGEQNLDEEIDVSRESVFEWGSVTKLLTWISVMQLVEDDLIDLEGDITEYLPDEFLDEFEQDDPVTMIHLMNHQGGFRDEIADLFVTDIPDNYSLEEEIKEHQPDQLYEPGAVTSYSNWGTALAGYIVEELSGQPFYEYVHDNILGPLDMDETALAPDLSDNPEIREARADTAGYLPSIPPTAEEQRHILLYPAGSAVSTLPDLVTFAQALFPSNNDTPLFDDRETMESMFEISQYYGDTDNPRNAHGFMVTNFDNPVYGHSGNTNAFTSNLLIDIEEDVGYAVMANEAQEVTYNFLLPETIFGDYDASENN